MGACPPARPEDGGVRALVGGADFADQQFNTAVRSRRQPRSVFKTFGLSAFVEDGHSPESRFPAPATITVEIPGFEPYEVSNFGRRDHGEQTLREATWWSTKTVFIQVAEEVGPSAVVETATSSTPSSCPVRSARSPHPPRRRRRHPPRHRRRTRLPSRRRHRYRSRVPTHRRRRDGPDDGDSDGEDEAATEAATEP